MDGSLELGLGLAGDGALDKAIRVRLGCEDSGVLALVLEALMPAEVCRIC
jgi:hypothetical protein